MLTPSQAACSIYNLPVTKENEEAALKRLKESGLEPAYLTDGNPYIAFAVSTSKINNEPWMYQRYSDVTVNGVTTLKYSFTYKSKNQRLHKRLQYFLR